MQNRKLPVNEKRRYAALTQYSIFQSGTDKDFDQLTFLAAEIFKVPVARVSIIGKKSIWHKSVVGSTATYLPREHSFCEEAIRTEGEVVIFQKTENPAIFERANGLYERDFHFYAAVPLVTPEGYPIGVFAICDTQPRALSIKEKNALVALADQCMKLFEARRQRTELQKVQKRLKQKYKDLEKFARLVSHDIKSPLANIISLTELLREENMEKLDDETLEYLDFLVESSYSLRNYVDGILNFYRSDTLLEKNLQDVELPAFFKEIVDLYDVSGDIIIRYPEEGTLKNVNKAALFQIFMNLISNALKYNNKQVRKVEIRYRESPEFYFFEVQDNGNGIPSEKLNRIFDLFYTLDTVDRDGNPGSGIGLATVKNHIKNMQGEIEVESQPEKGSNFKFRIKKL